MERLSSSSPCLDCENRYKDLLSKECAGCTKWMKWRCDCDLKLAEYEALEESGRLVKLSESKTMFGAQVKDLISRLERISREMEGEN